MNHEQKIGAVEELLARGHVTEACQVLKMMRPEKGAPEILDWALERDPTCTFLLELRAAVYWLAGLHRECARDLVRALLVAEKPEHAQELLDRLARTTEWVDLEPWQRKARRAARSRLAVEEVERERSLLLDAIDLAPDEPNLYVAFARTAHGPSPALELCALRQAVRRAPGWAEGFAQVARLEHLLSCRTGGGGDARRERRAA